MKANEWKIPYVLGRMNICTKQFLVPNTFKQMKVVYSLHTPIKGGGKKKMLKKTFLNVSLLVNFSLSLLLIFYINK